MIDVYFKKLKNLRVDNDLTQKQIAEIIGCSQQTYSDYENGKYDIPNEVLIKLADYYRVSVDYILGRTKNKKFPW